MIIQNTSRELQCHANSVGGSIRHIITPKLNGIRLSKAEKMSIIAELNHTEELLYKAASSQCVLIDTQSGSMSQFPILAIQILGELNQKKDKNALSTHKDTARLLDAAAKVSIATFDLSKVTGKEYYDQYY